MMIFRLAIAGLIAIGCATASVAVAKSKTAPKSKLAAVVDLENKRPASLMSFEIVMPADTDGKGAEKVVAKLAKPLASGKRMKLRLEGAKGCVFEARWKFEDTSDAGFVDLCHDAHIVLVD